MRSGILRKLHKGLFRKKKRKHGSSPDMIPDVRVKRAWGDNTGSPFMVILLFYIVTKIRYVYTHFAWLKKHFFDKNVFY